MPERIRSDQQTRDVFFDLVDEKAHLLIAKKVAKMNGDLRVAFDLLKSSFVLLQRQIEEREDFKVRVTISEVAEVFKEKYGSKIPETLKKLPRQNLMILEVMVL